MLSPSILRKMFSKSITLETLSFLLWFLGHTKQPPGLNPNYVLRDHFRWDTRNHMQYQESNQIVHVQGITLVAVLCLWLHIGDILPPIPLASSRVSPSYHQMVILPFLCPPLTATLVTKAQCPNPTIPMSTSLTINASSFPFTEAP